MTDLIQHGGLDPIELEADPAGPEPGARTAQTGPTPPKLSWSTRRPAQVLLAVLAASLAACTFTAAAQSLHTSRSDALAYALVGWAALTLGMLALIRPTRRVLASGLIGGAALAGFWLVQLGLATHATVSSAQIARLVLAVAIAALSGVLLARPAFGQSWDTSTSVLLSILPVAVVVAVTAALVGTASPATVVVAGAPRSPVTTTRTPNPLAAVPVPGQNSGAFAKLAQGNDTEKAEQAPYVPLATGDQATLDAQLSQAEQAAMRFPTVASAKAAGMVLAGGMAPGVGAHYQLLSADTLKGVNADGTVNAAFPGSWIYAGTADNDPVVGVMYESLSEGRPTGFVGPNDHWHQHSNLCIQYTAGKIKVPFAPDSSVTPQQCASVHGQFMRKTVWMVHAWVVPGWESPQGVFSHANLHIYCPGNTYLVDPLGFCLRQS